MKNSKKLKKTKLTIEEDKIWINNFEYYKNKGYSDKKADLLTFYDMIKEFPRLSKYNIFE